MTSPQSPLFQSYFRDPDQRRCRDRLADLRTVYAQVGRINRRQDDLAVRHDLTYQIQLRHQRGRRRLPRNWPGRTFVTSSTSRSHRDDLRPIEFDVVPDRHGDEVPVAPEELLMRREDVDSTRGRNLIDAYGLREISRHLDDRLVRLRAAGARGARLADLVGALTAHGVRAYMHYVVPTGVVWKGLGGAEISAGPGPVPPPAGAVRPPRVAVIDTGIADEVRTDGWLINVTRNGNIDPLDALPAPDGLLDLAAGHGTFCAGVVQQVAPEADIVVYRALDTDGIGSEITVADAMVRAARIDGAQILNLSLGIETVDNQPPAAFTIALDLIHEFEAANSREVLVVAAAGNFGHDRECWPAAFESVTGVAALTQDFAGSPWSTRGAWVDCSTIGEGVRSTFVEGKESPLIDPMPDTFGPNAWALWSGTSFTAPQVAGAVALAVRQGSGLTVRSALAHLLGGRPTLPGYGRVLQVLPPI